MKNDAQVVMYDPKANSGLAFYCGSASTPLVTISPTLEIRIDPSVKPDDAAAQFVRTVHEISLRTMGAQLGTVTKVQQYKIGVVELIGELDAAKSMDKKQALDTLFASLSPAEQNDLLMFSGLLVRLFQ